MTQMYIGTKLIMAWEEAASKDYGNHKQGSPGYAVKYADGYISWSPKEVFESAYLPIGSDEPTGFIGYDVVEDFIVSHKIIETENSVIATATLGNQMVITQAVDKTSVVISRDEESEDRWEDHAAQLAFARIRTEVSKHLTFLLACAQNGILPPQIQEVPKSEMDTEEE